MTQRQTEIRDVLKDESLSKYIFLIQPTDEDEDEDDEAEQEQEQEEEALDEETQLMASMGLPLAFGSSSDQRREVCQSCLLNSEMFGVTQSVSAHVTEGTIPQEDSLIQGRIS